MSKITVQTTINAPVDKVWQFYTNPGHIKNWNKASDDWHTTKCENDLKVGGKFLYRMEAKDGSQGFDFTGVYTAVELNRLIKYTMDDGREAKIDFESTGDKTKVTVTFGAEQENSLEMQKTAGKVF